MDVSPRALRAVTFREKLRGYHPEDVDKFLERVAEGVAGLTTKLEDALARAEKAEKERAETSVSEESVQRTLTLAQRTADMALREAKDDAARIIAAARDEADRIAEAAQKQLRDDLERLEAARKHLSDDVRAMQQYVDQERTRIRAALAELLRKVDSTARKPPAQPAPTKLDVPPPVGSVRPERPHSVEPPPAAPAVAVVPEPEPEPERVPDPVPEAVSEPVPEAEPETVDVEAPPEPVQDADLAPAVAEPAPPRIKREPQPPPVPGTPFGAAKPAVKPSGPPPGPRRATNLADDPSPTPVEPFSLENGERSGLRGMFGR
jgi:DivIVA domain-containing protein